MKQITPIVLTYVFIIGIITAIIYHFSPKPIEPFVAAERCAAVKDCSSCTTLDGCAWCADTETCRPLTDGCPGPAEEVILQKAQCPSTVKLAGTVSGKDSPTTSDVAEKRRLALIKKYVDRIVLNYAKLNDASKKEADVYLESIKTTPL